jgi:hypothetical protein
MIKVELSKPDDLSRGEWAVNQDIAEEAFNHNLLYRTPQEVAELVNRKNRTDYFYSHINPNNEVGKRFNANQSYSKPRVALAYVDEALAGWGYAADNVSGSNEVIRIAKRLSVVKNFFWLREIVVRPEFMRLGVAKEIGKTLLKSAVERQPVSIYMWPNEEPAFMSEQATKLGFIPTGEKQVQLFGPTNPVRQVRMQATSVKSVLAQLN